jgi:molybdate transport system substrate-binding protein
MALLAACGAQESSAEKPEVSVFAAASLQDVIKELGQMYQERTGNEPVYNFAGSNELARQILAAPKADVFLTANEDWMNKVQDGGRVVDGTRTTLLSNRLAVVANTDSPYQLANPADLATLPYRQLILADPEAVPAGIYAKEWLSSAPNPGGAGTLWDAVSARVVPALDVRAALALVESDPQLIGIVYRTDVVASDMVRVLYEVPEAAGPKIVYVAAAISGGPNTDGGRAFVDFLKTTEASEVFKRYGFIPTYP